MEFTSIVLSQEFEGQFYDFGIATTAADRFSYSELNASQAAELSNSSGIDVIVLLAGDDTATDDSSSRIYFGNTGNDTIDGADGNDTIAAGQGNDSVIGGNGNDVLAGNLGNDVVTAGAGADVVFGGQGNDTIDGGSGSDLLSGDLGDDTLTGGSGFDVLTGGDGSDRFVLEVGNNLDTITDFISGTDLLQLPDGVAYSDLSFSATGSNTLIQTTSGTSIALLQGISPTALSEANFVAASGSSGSNGSSATTSSVTLDEFEAEVLALTNQFREASGVGTLTANAILSQASETHSQNMANLDFFSHTGQDGSNSSDRAIAAGYDSTFVGENIAVGYSTPADVVQGWIDSEGHRANLLNESYTKLGVGYVFLAEDTGSQNWNHYWTQMFG